MNWKHRAVEVAGEPVHGSAAMHILYLLCGNEDLRTWKQLSALVAAFASYLYLPGDQSHAADADFVCSYVENCQSKVGWWDVCGPVVTGCGAPQCSIRFGHPMDHTALDLAIQPHGDGNIVSHALCSGLVALGHLDPWGE